MNLIEWTRWWKDVGAAQLSQLLMQTWDPIGVASFPSASDEYDDYVVRIAGGLRLGHTPAKIAAELHEYRTGSIGLPANDEADLAAATAIVNWYSLATEEWFRTGDIRRR